MPRTEVYQLRLTRAEKDSLAAQAREAGVSIAVLIRGRLYLSTGQKERLRREKIKKDLTTARRVKSSKALTVHISKEELDGAAAAENHELSLDLLTQKLKNQGYTTRVAERMARKQLGI